MVVEEKNPAMFFAPPPKKHSEISININHGQSGSDEPTLLIPAGNNRFLDRPPDIQPGIVPCIGKLSLGIVIGCLFVMKNGHTAHYQMTVAIFGGGQNLPSVFIGECKRLPFSEIWRFHIAVHHHEIEFAKHTGYQLPRLCITMNAAQHVLT